MTISLKLSVAEAEELDRRLNGYSNDFAAADEVQTRLHVAYLRATGNRLPEPWEYED